MDNLKPRFLVMKITIIISTFIFFFSYNYPQKSFAQDKNSNNKSKNDVQAILYFNQEFGNVHSSTLKSSTTLTTLGCGHPVKVLKSKKSLDENWCFVRVGLHEGYILKQFLSEKRPTCFQSRYPKFFDQLNLDLTQLYYWGRLSDQYVFGKSQVGHNKQ